MGVRLKEKYFPGHWTAENDQENVFPATLRRGTAKKKNSRASSGVERQRKSFPGCPGTEDDQENVRENFQGRSAIWGAATLGLVIGLVVGLVKGDVVNSILWGIGIGVVVGIVAEILGRGSGH